MIIRKHWNHNRIAILGLIIIFLFGFALSAHAANVTWTGGGSDNLASNPANWSGNILPQYGDDVIFDSTSKDCTWDLNVTLALLSIKSGYSGKVTKTSGISLTIAANFVPPTAPSGLSATAISSSQINLSWTDNSNNETGFKIERKTGAGGTYSQIAVVGANVTNYSNTGLTPGSTYYYKVRAYNSFGDSAPSNEAYATTLTAPPTAVTDPATNVTHDFARINGTVNPNGYNTTAYFELGTDTSYGLFTSSTISIGSGTNNVIIWVDITGFSPETTYHYRVVAANAGGTRYGNDVSFTTNPLPGTIQVNATLNGVTWTGSVNYTITGPETINGASAPATFTGKQVGDYTLTYNSGGPVNAILSSITPSAAQTLPSQGTITFTLNFIYSSPTATTNPATNVNGNSATLNATVNPNGSATTVYFQWGTSASYGYTTSAQSIGSGTSNVSVTANITGLAPATTYHYRIVASNANGTTNGLDVTFTTPPITITITSPLDSSTINRPDVMVKGTVTNTTGNETGVTVNGVVATVYNGQFFVNHMPLQDGQNTITATATDTAGNTATTSITVNAVTSAPHVTLNANIESGIAPLTTYFSVSTSIPNAVSTYQMDYEGDGSIDYTGTTFDNISFIYTTEGVYYPTVIVTDTQGIQYSDTIAIVVLNASQLDALLRAKWEAMKTALINQDVEGSVKDITENSKDTYREQFTDLSSVLDIIGNELGQIQLVSIQDNKAEYEVTVTRNGTTYSFHLLFVRDSNGLWKIQRF
ncbi:MAG: hypothetical protein A2W05_02180 [Candidatus Schekmanbacteria bacterium RBG_16_38_10]|uniref:Fibronectin type-III domain-containing protein n=1 Tax=Candidatus Schekmanbacteria bacterium RBG_16_38_10 TaxID=1817879 RepID=A0A1F7RYU7_9BACT|nr:MAG: hypothetical protein A2W05_02180 [Candidatus Schekmanbacteria bacterium RBG_16_38_10]